MKEILESHQPVLLPEVMLQLAIKPDGVYVDATFGRGGHAKTILANLNENGRLFCIDKDPEAISFAQKHFSSDPRFSIQQGSFADLKRFLVNQELYGQIDGILFDLGVSSPQLDDAARGFSFMRNGALDMRMDNSRGESAAEWIAKVPEKELANVLWEYGEERFSRRIAAAVVKARAESPITTTEQLADIIKKAHPAWQKGKNPATQSFQAIRMKINNELADLEQGLAQCVDALKIGGRLCVISFHSLEDRIVKHFMQKEEQGMPLPSKLPIKKESQSLKFKRIGRAIKPSMLELDNNPRSRSAVLRVGEKIS
jgi:16S rRNA (cytosine1402-N4)-methyltransferase